MTTVEAKIGEVPRIIEIAKILSDKNTRRRKNVGNGLNELENGVREK